MAEETTERKLPVSRSIIHYGLFVLVLLGYFSSEALMRRLVYDTPGGTKSEEEAEKLISSMPEFFQSYLKAYAKRLEIQDKLKVTTDPEKRIELLFELSALSGKETGSRSIMMKIVEEAPHSPKILPAWMVLLDSMTDEEALEAFVTYLNNCDFRRPRPKIKHWISGANLMSRRGKQTRLKYYTLMAKMGIIDDDLVRYYEELLISAESSGDEQFIKQVKSVYSLSKEKAIRKMEAARKKAGR